MKRAAADASAAEDGEEGAKRAKVVVDDENFLEAFSKMVRALDTAKQTGLRDLVSFVHGSSECKSFLMRNQPNAENAETFLVMAQSAKRKAEEAEARAKREAEEAEARAKRKAEEAEARAKREAEEAEARAKREAEEAEARAKREAEEAEAKAKREAEEAEARAKREADAKSRMTRAINKVMSLVGEQVFERDGLDKKVRDLSGEGLDRIFAAQSIDDLWNAGVLARKSVFEDLSAVVAREVGAPFPVALVDFENPSVEAILRIHQMANSEPLRKLPCPPFTDEFSQRLSAKVSAWLEPGPFTFSSLGSLAHLQLHLPVSPPSSEAEIAETRSSVFHRTLEILISECSLDVSSSLNLSPFGNKSGSARSSGKKRPDYFLRVKDSRLLLIEEDKGPKGGLDEALEQCCGYARSDFNLDCYGTLWFKLGLLVTPDIVQLLLLVDLRRVPLAIFTELKEREASITVYDGSQEVRAVLLQHLSFYPPHGPAQAFQRSLALCEIVPLAVNAFRIMRTFMGLAFIPAEISGNEGLIVSKWENGAFLFYKFLNRDRIKSLEPLYQLFRGARDSSNLHLQQHLVDAVLDVEESRVVVRTPGICRFPCNETELKEAIRGVLLALQILHGAGIAHCDIRWPNIIRAFNPPRWVLIDLECMQRFDTTPPKLRIHPPPEDQSRSAEHVHAAYDLWMVGKLFYSDKLPFTITQEARDFARSLKKDAPAERLTLDGALCHPWLAEQQQ